MNITLYTAFSIIRGFTQPRYLKVLPVNTGALLYMGKVLLILGEEKPISNLNARYDDSLNAGAVGSHC
jgi:hypothetical protein